jgi:hypothetical protein
MSLSRGALMQLQLPCGSMSVIAIQLQDCDLLLILAKIHGALGCLVAHLVG